MLHNVWVILPMVLIYGVLGTVIMLLAWWACNLSEDHDDWVFFGGQGADHDDRN